ncbi:MAG: hypothetical protein H6713_13840 [Myxococcales bacterium]|nr:hypothetical protein [Myxococcales bacterium]MCB9751066.1 hypothetical protein [Myxococcales bacterium]
MPKLNQILAIEKGVKTRCYGEITELHKATQKTSVMNGFHKTYQRRDEEGETYPPESQKVRFNHKDVIKRIGRALAELFDITATKDWANCSARATVVVDGKPLLEDVPATYLLFLEKQLSDLRTFIDKMVELDAGEDWLEDPSTGMYRTEAIKTQRTKKVQRPIVLYDATEHHPAQTQLITEDVVAGYWNTVKYSGAIPSPKKIELLERIDKLARAVKFAREEANSLETEQRRVGEAVLGYLLGV